MLLSRIVVCLGCGLAAAIPDGDPAAAQPARIGGLPRLEAWELHCRMADQSPWRDLEWQRLGPKFAGGRIESIDAPRGDSATLYAGVGAGGIWKSVNAGLTWQPVFENESTFAIGDLTIAPSNPDVIWVGTGECHLSGTSYPGNGVFKSLDAGQTWLNTGLHESAHIGKVVVHPADPDHVHVAAIGRSRRGGQRGVYLTRNGGQDWKRALYVNDQVGFVDLVMDPYDPNVLYAAGWDRGNGPDSGVWRTDDGGESWQRLTGGLPGGPLGRIALDVAASQPGVVYALVTDRSSPELARRGHAAMLFRSDDHGHSWRRTHEDYLPTYVGWDFCDVRVAPDNADRVYVGGLRLIRSEDGGRTFQGEGGFAVNEKPDEVFRLHPHRGIGMHLDVHDIWIDPENPGRVLLGNDGGLYMSHDRGATWLHLNNLPIAEFYRVHVDNQDPFRIWGGTQDNASFAGPATARFRAGQADTWQQVFLDPWSGGDGFSTFPDPRDPDTTFYTQQNGDLKRSARGRLTPLQTIRPRAGRGEPQLRFAWDTPFFASTHAGPTVLYCAAQRVMRSADRGDSWQAISPDLSDQGLLALAESPLDAGRLVAGGGRQKIHVTRDGGDHWEPVGDGLPDRRLRDVVASVHDPERLYAVFSGKDGADSASYLFTSPDFGASWTSIAGNLPHESLNTLVEDPQHPQRLFVGTDLGVYVSDNRGQQWHSLCDSLPTAPVVDLALHSDQGILVAATHGLSLFSLDINPIRQGTGRSSDSGVESQR